MAGKWRGDATGRAESRSRGKLAWSSERRRRLDAGTCRSDPLIAGLVATLEAREPHELGKAEPGGLPGRGGAWLTMGSMLSTLRRYPFRAATRGGFPVRASARQARGSPGN